jgi:hypothetical protein
MTDADITKDRPIWDDDRPRTVFQLSVTESTGPYLDDHGYAYGQLCPDCNVSPVRGEEICRFGEQWWHLACARTHMRNGGADTAWLMLGADLAARPSRYSVSETRAITRNLLRLTTRITKGEL